MGICRRTLLHQARLLYAARALNSRADNPEPAPPVIPDIAAKSGIFASNIPVLNGSKCANEHFSGTFWQRDSRDVHTGNGERSEESVADTQPSEKACDRWRQQQFDRVLQRQRRKARRSYRKVC